MKTKITEIINSHPEGVRESELLSELRIDSLPEEIIDELIDEGVTQEFEWNINGKSYRFYIPLMSNEPCPACSIPHAKSRHR